jgi:hypothetical protein
MLRGRGEWHPKGDFPTRAHHAPGSFNRHGEALSERASVREGRQRPGPLKTTRQGQSQHKPIDLPIAFHGIQSFKGHIDHTHPSSTGSKTLTARWINAISLWVWISPELNVQSFPNITNKISRHCEQREAVHERRNQARRPTRPRWPNPWFAASVSALLAMTGLASPLPTLFRHCEQREAIHERRNQARRPIRPLYAYHGTPADPAPESPATHLAPALQPPHNINAANQQHIPR